MISLLLMMTQLPPEPCHRFWPNDTDGTQRVAAPSNIVIWAPSAPQFRSENGEDVSVEATDGEPITYNGIAWHPFRVEGGWANRCLVADNNEDMGRLCVGSEADDEPPIDPVLSGELGLPTYGGSSSYRGDCVGSFSGGNLRLTIEADETGPLLAHVVVRAGDLVIADEVQPMSGTLQLSMDAAQHPSVEVAVQFIDQAGQFGELATISLTAPPGGCQGCSHSGFGLFLLAALGALRRRQR